MDAYAKHLVQVNDTNGVQASSDIKNNLGQILVKKGSNIDQSTVDKIARFKLLRPLESSINIQNEFTSESLQSAFHKFFETESSLFNLFQKLNDEKDLKSCCEYFCRFSLLKQKLTVLSLILPNIFEQALFCSWLSIVLSKQILQSSVANQEIFIASLCHDIGMVHISCETLNKKGDLTLEEWKLIQSHPVIGYNILKGIKGLKPIVARTILEHHEHLDGTGYPRGCIGAMLCQEGQILNLLDCTNALYNKLFRPAGRSLKEVLPIIQMNQHSRFGLAAKHLVLILREIPDVKKPAISEELAKVLIDSVRERNNYISLCIDICGEFANQLGYIVNSPVVNSLQNAIIHITMSIAQSGIINDAYIRWLEQVENEGLVHAYPEVEEAFLMMQEIIYHLNQLVRQLELSVEKSKDKKLIQILKDSRARLKSIPPPPLTDKLRERWPYF